METSIVSTFFDNLSMRMWKENDLSDITWSLCQSSPYFYNYFIHFFFPELDIKSIVEFEREHPDEQDCGSRVDFLIRVQNDEVPYLIEVKINDRNQHFGQYDEAYGVTPDRLGYITNYPLFQEGYDRIRQWSELYDSLSTDIDIVAWSDLNEKVLIEGYLSYVKNVCNIINFNKKMNLQNLYSMFELFQILKGLTTRQESDFTVSFYGNNETQNGYNLKFWFEINYIDSNIPKDWGVIGLWYDKEQPILAVGFYKDEGWGKHIYESLEKQKFTEYQYCSTPYKDGGYFFIEMKEDVMKTIDESTTLDEQKTIIRNFMDEALRIPLGKSSI